MKIKNLVNLIKRASEAYYTGDVKYPIISDDQFDVLVGKLRALDPENPILTTPGWGYTPKSSKKPHNYGIVGSLDSIDFDKCSKESIITPKYDGISITVEYRDGKLYQGLTRGTGLIGKDVTHHVTSLVPHEIPFTGLVCFRSEAVIDREVFAEKYSKDFATERNFVAGVMNRKTKTPMIKDIDLVFYQILGYSGNVSSLNEKSLLLGFIEKMGLKVAPTYSGEFNRDTLEKWSKSIGYLTDGVVLTGSVLSIFEDDKILISEHSFSHKFESEEKDGTVDYIEWSTGGAGHVTPVVVLTSPISLAGVNVQRATAHNALYVKENGIGTGATLSLKRANEVIPYITNIAHPVLPVLPTLCPACNSVLEWYKSLSPKGNIVDGKHLICVNPSCIAQTKTPIFRLIGLLGLGDGLGETTINKWLDAEGIKTVADLLDFAKKDYTGLDSIKSLMGKHYGKLIHNLINKLIAKCGEGFSYQEFWYILNFNTLATSNSKKVAHINPIEITLDNITDKMGGILPQPAIKALKTHFSYWKDVLSKISLKEEKIVEKKVSYKVCITGKLNGFKNRNAFVKYLEQFGVEHTSINKKTDYLISNEASTSAKSQKAKKLGVPVVSEAEFLEMIKIN